MKGAIFGFHRDTRHPKCTPASMSCWTVTDSMVFADCPPRRQASDPGNIPGPAGRASEGLRVASTFEGRPGTGLEKGGTFGAAEIGRGRLAAAGRRRRFSRPAKKEGRDSSRGRPEVNEREAQAARAAPLAPGGLRTAPRPGPRGVFTGISETLRSRGDPEYVSCARARRAPLPTCRRQKQFPKSVV